MKSYAQNFEDVYLERAFKDVENGFYIDLGAYHPVIDSVTKHFYDRGWSGINVEPGPSFDTFPAARPRDKNLRLAITARSGSAKFYYHAGDPGTSTLMPDLDAGLTGKVGQREVSIVNSITLNELLKQYASDRHLHFLKIDIEGAEEEVIKSTDWSTYRPEILVIEATFPYTNRRRDNKWNDVLVAADYVLAFFDGINTYYLDKRSMSRMSAFNAPVNVLDRVVKHDGTDPDRPAAAETVVQLADRLAPSEPEAEAVQEAPPRPAPETAMEPVEAGKAGSPAKLELPGAESLAAQMLAFMQSERDVSARYIALAGEADKREIAALSAKVTELEAMARSARHEKAALDDELRDAKRASEEKDGRIADLTATTDSIGGHIIALGTEIQEVRQELGERAEHVAILQAELTVGAQQEALRSKQLGELRAALAEKDERIAALAAEALAAKEEAALAAEQKDEMASAFRVEAAELAAQLETAGHDLRTSKWELAARDDQMKALSAQMAASDDHAVAVIEQRDKLIVDWNNFVAQIRDGERKLADYSQIIADNERQLADAVSALAAMNDKLRDSAMEMQDKDREIEIVRREGAMVLEMMIDSERHSKAVLEKIVEDLTKRLDEAGQEKTALGEALDLARKQYEDAANTLYEATAANATYKAAIDTHAGDIDRVRRECALLMEAMLEAPRQEIAMLGQALGEATGRVVATLPQFDGGYGLAEKLANERARLVYDLEFPDGPRALRMVLPLARAIRFTTNLVRKKPAPPAK